jgi:hypothetical protein
VQFIALLRALSLAVGAFGVSHAQIERRLCGHIADGQAALARLREGSPDEDRAELRYLADRKNAIEESGLARTDGRRDKAGGQRIGELLAGKFPRGGMPSRRRAEVCFGILLEILEEKDPFGFSEGRYGTREQWQELWLQADQGNVPMLDATATTVTGYLDAAVKQLAGLLDEWQESTTLVSPADPATRPAADQADGAPAGHVSTPLRDLTEELTRVRDEARREADRRVADANAERDEARARAETAERESDRLRVELERQGRLAARWGKLAAALAVTVAGALVLVVVGAFRAASTDYVVQLTAQPQNVSPDQQATFVFLPGLPADRDWRLRVQLAIAPTDPSAGCTYGAQTTFHVEADGEAFPAFTSQPGQVSMTQDLRIGHKGSRSLRLIVTRLTTDAGCVLQVSPAGSQASATQ